MQTIRTIHYDPFRGVTEANGHFIARGKPDIEAGIYLLREDVAAYLRSIDTRGNSGAELAAAADHITTTR